MANQGTKRDEKLREILEREAPHVYNKVFEITYLVLIIALSTSTLISMFCNIKTKIFIRFLKVIVKRFTNRLSSTRFNHLHRK